MGPCFQEMESLYKPCNDVDRFLSSYSYDVQFSVGEETSDGSLVQTAQDRDSMSWLPLSPFSSTGPSWLGWTEFSSSGLRTCEAAGRGQDEDTSGMHVLMWHPTVSRVLTPWAGWDRGGRRRTHRKRGHAGLDCSEKGLSPAWSVRNCPSLAA